MTAQRNIPTKEELEHASKVLAARVEKLDPKRRRIYDAFVNYEDPNEEALRMEIRAKRARGEEIKIPMSPLARKIKAGLEESYNRGLGEDYKL